MLLVLLGDVVIHNDEQVVYKETTGGQSEGTKGNDTQLQVIIQSPWLAAT